MKKKIEKILVYIASFLICWKIYFGLYEFVVNKVLGLPLEAIAIIDIFVILFVVPAIIAGGIGMAKLFYKGTRSLRGLF